MSRLFSALFVCMIAALAQPAAAATLYLDPPETTLSSGDTIAVAVRLDVDEAGEECINAADGVLTVSSELELLDVSIGRSIFSMWVEAPTIDRVNNKVTFAGGIPNGYCGRIEGDPQLTNTIAELIVRAPLHETASGTVGRIGFSPESLTYLNDGFGTAVTPSMYGATITLTGQQAETIRDDWKAAVEADTNPPAGFSVLLSTNPAGKYVVSFNTTDKQTGIDHYEVMEQPLEQFGTFSWGRANAPWITARSPYQLKDQSLNSAIYVKAIDKAGNETITTFVPDESLRTLSDRQLVGYVLMSVVGVVLVVVAVGVYMFMRRRRPRTVVKANESNSYEA